MPTQNIINKIADLKEMRLLKVREIDSLSRRILEWEKVLYNECKHDWESLFCKKCNLKTDANINSCVFNVNKNT